MFDSATLNLFGAITIFVIFAVFGRDVLVQRGMSKAVAQSVAGLVGVAVAVVFLLAVG